MRHRWMGRKLGRTQSPRAMLARNLVNSLFTYGRIITTVEKAKEFRSLAERMITLAKKGGLHRFRLALSQMQDRTLVHKLFRDIAPRFQDRPGGYTRIVRLGGCRWDGEGRGQWAGRRLGDNGQRAIFELVVKKSREEELAPLARTEKAAAAGAAKEAPKKKQEQGKKEKKAKAAAK